ncbi:hypothetical protein PM082_022285 [Marasmius tenuissimus]|nr:hypothetical protein PM082_022285 [Marasmius tenuissimus]
MFHEAITRQEEILRRDEGSLLQRLQTLSVHDQVPASQSDNPDPRSRSQDLVNTIGHVKDELGTLLERIPQRSSFSGVSANYSVDQSRLELRRCRAEVVGLHKRFLNILSSSRLRSSSAIIMRDEVLLDFKGAFCTLKEEREYWLKVKENPQTEPLATFNQQQAELPPNRIVTTGEFIHSPWAEAAY